MRGDFPEAEETWILKYGMWGVCSCMVLRVGPNVGPNPTGVLQVFWECPEHSH